MPGSQSVSGDEQDEGRGGGKSKAHTSKDVSHVPCKFFKVGSCTAGAACPFSHSAAEPGQQKQVCNWYIKGQCKFAHKCALAHLLPGQPMSMDRKNKKAAQQAQQAAGGGHAGGQQGHGSGHTQPNSGGQANGSQKSEEDRGHREPSRRDRDRHRSDRPPRDRPQRERGNREGGEKSSSRGGPRGDNPMASSTATLRPPIQIGKAPSISAAVTAPPVTSTTSFVARSEEADPEKDSATASLEQLQAHAHVRQTTITQENVALSDYSKTPSATTVALPPAAPLASSPKSDLGSGLQRSSPLPTTSPKVSNHLSPKESNFGPIGSPRRGDFGYVGSPPRAMARNDMGQYGSPPRQNNAFAAVADAGSSALANLLAGLRQGTDLGSSTVHPSQEQISPARPGMPSSHSSQSNLHLHAATSGFGTSPFAAAGSKGLYMPYPDSASSSVASQSNMHANLAGATKELNNGYPASFAGSRAFGWGAGAGPRRPSLPGHNQRPSMGGLSSGGINESALEEEEDDALEAEEFLPSSLNDLLTTEERARRYSRTGGRPRGESLTGRGGFQQQQQLEADETPAWGQNIRRVPQEQQQTSTTNDALSRSVPAANIFNNVRNIWQADHGQSNGAPNQIGDLGMSRRTGIAHALASNPNNAHHGEEPFSPSAGSFAGSSGMLGTSVASNASNAFLHSTRVDARGLGGDIGAAQFDVSQGFTSPNDLHTGGAPASYHPQSSMFPQQPPQRTSQAQQHQQRSSLSALSASLLQSTQNQGQANAGSANPYPMYSGPANTTSPGLGYATGVQDHHRPGPVHPHRQPLGPNTSIHGAAGAAAPPSTGLRHEPGQSLPRGLGAGLSRIHLVPAMGVSLSSGAGSPGSGIASPGFVASPPGFAGLRNGLPSAGANSSLAGVGYGSGWPGAGGDLNLGGDKTGLATTPTRNFASGLTARLMAAGITSNPNGGRQVNDLQPEPSSTATLPITTSNPTNLGMPVPGRPPGLVSDLLDEGTLFMD